MPMVDSTTDLADWLTGRMATYLIIEADQIDHERPLAEYGLDSVYAFSMCVEIEDSFGLVVEPTLAWDYPTVTAIAGYLHGRLTSRAEGVS